MAQKGAAEVIFRGRREQKAVFPPWANPSKVRCPPLAAPVASFAPPTKKPWLAARGGFSSITSIPRYLHAADWVVAVRSGGETPNMVGAFFDVS